jgi:hypothetical protein
MRTLRNINTWRKISILGEKVHDVCADNKLTNENIEKHQGLEKRFVDVCANNKKLKNDVSEMKKV